MPSAFPFFVEKAQEHLDKYVSKRADGIGQMFRRNWLLGFTCFGGPAVHFQIASTMRIDLDHFSAEILSVPSTLC